MQFKNDKEALEFLATFVSSETWKWMEEVLKARKDLVLVQLDNPRTTADGRAMLTGRLLELHRLLEFPMKSFLHFEGQKTAAAMPQGTGQAIKDAIISKVANPDIAPTGE